MVRTAGMEAYAPAAGLRKCGYIMECRIIRISNYGEQIINSISRGIVHSVYRTAVNLSIGDRMAALQPAGSPMSPVSLITNLGEQEFDRLEIEAGSPVHITEKSLIIEPEQMPGGCLRFLRQGAEREDLKLAKLPSPIMVRKLADDLEKILAGDAADGFWPVLFSGAPDVSLVTAAAKKRTGEAAKLLRECEWRKAADSLCGLIGLGAGLTPGGDDFLCGVLAGMMLTGLGSHPFADCLKYGIRAGIDRTNDISRMFLTCALEDQFGTAVHAFYDGQAENIIDGMRQIGHTSGIDTLCGILYVFRIWEENNGGL